MRDGVRRIGGGGMRMLGGHGGYLMR